MSQTNVAVAVILGCNNQVLIAKRKEGVPQGGLWEFPGGKIEIGETSNQALFRELEEELTIAVLEASFFLKTEHKYPELNVTLDAWIVSNFTGRAKGNEGQLIAWVPVDQLKLYEFPEANIPIIDALQSYLID